MSERWTRYDVWHTSSNDSKFRRWQRWMRRSASFRKRTPGLDFTDISGQRSFKCEFCDRYADYANYETLGLFCTQHAEDWLAWKGITPWWKWQPRQEAAK